MSNAQESPPNDGITADYVTIHNKLLNSIEKKIQKYDLTNAESFLTFWSETNDAVITYDYLLSSSVNPSVIFCVVALESPIVGKVFITDASATVKEIATRLASVKAVKYLLKANLITSEDVKSIDLDLPEYDSDVLDNLQKFMFASTNNKNRSNPVANSSLNQEKSVDCGKSMINRNENGKLEQNHIDKLVETRSSKSITLETFPEKDRESANNVMESQESSSSAVRPEKSQNLDSQENEKIVTENMQNIVLNGGDCNYSSFKDATSFLRNWCDRNNVVALSECAYIKAVSMKGFVCSLALSSSTGNLFLTESASLTEEGACLFASKKAVSYLVDNGKVTLDEIGHINLHVPKVEAVILRKLQNSQKAEQFEEQKIEEFVESPMSSDSEGTSDEDSDSDSNIRESRNAKAVCDDQNGGSDQEQNHIEEVDEMEAHAPISSEDILDKNADTTKFVLESQNESSEAVINGDSQEHSQEIPTQNSTMYPASKNQSNKKIVLSDWCRQNNIHLAVDFAPIQIGPSRIELCTVTLKWTTNDKSFSTGAVGNSSKMAERLATKKALIHLMSEGLVMPDEINRIDLNTNKSDKSTNEKVKQFLSDKANKAKSRLSFDLIHRLEESVSSFPIDQKNEKSQLEEWCSAHGLKMEISTSKIVEAIFECKVIVEPYDYVGSGKGKRCPSFRRACLDFINHLQEDDKPDKLEVTDDPIIVLREWCKDRELKLQHKSEKTDPAKHQSRVKVESFSFSGIGIGPDVQSAENLACRRFIDRLRAEKLFPKKIDVSPMEARVLKKLEFTPHIKSRYYKKGSKIDFKLQENKKKTSASRVSYKPAKSNPTAELEDWCMKNGLTVKYEWLVLNGKEYLYQVKVPPHEYIGTGNGSNSVAKQRACQDFINHLPKECKRQVLSDKIVRSASKALSDWCSKQGLEMDCKRRKTVPRKYEFVVRVQSFDFVGTGIERKKRYAREIAAQDFLDRLMAEGIRKQESDEAVNDGCDSDVEFREEKDETEECAQHEKLSEAADESRTSTPLSQCCSENVTCEDSGSSIVFMDEDEEESNKKSEQNEENTMDVAESRTSLPLPNEFPESTQCEDSGSDIDPLEEQVSSSEDGLDADLPERSQNSPQQQIDESFLAFKQEIIKNRSLGSGGEITSLHDWCQQNNVAFKLKYHFGPTTGTKRNVWFCALTLSSPTVGEFCSFSAPGSKRKACEPLVTKFAFNYLVQEEFVIRDQIKSHNIDLTPTEARILKKLQFTPHITSRYYKKGSKIDFKLQENKKTSSSAVSYTPAKSKPKAILDDWCKKNGLTVNYECGVLNMAGYHIQVKVPPYEYIGTGNGSSGVANQRACQDFINHLPKECKPQVSGNQKASVVLRDWCTMQGLKMFCNKTTTVPRKTKCVVRVQSFDFVGTGIERMRKDAEDTAAQVFLDHLMAEGMRQQESHEAVDDGCDSDVDILEEKVQLNEGANTLPKIDLSSITHLFKKANSSQCINVTPGYWIGSEEAGLQQFFDENNINAQYTLSTDPDCSEGCHVASMQFYVRRIGKSFSASSNGSTVTEAKAKCASLLLKQLILANLFDGLKQRKAIAPIKEPIELDVPDELVQSIIQLCTEFDVNTPELVSCKMCQLND
ncbi:uncharacterized protein LOC111046153 isoform X6 [Nilaparvata lugens]|uniref:uncharacterized protein LOC111046153 isoform X6 n=1 Tax=Nilaparvata lugens TaxID=108931 RepID=UPI00193E8C17|nr:uncharacterized protein LOC111046153 isoform X6 [Nilaparvata lugens]